jgi:hypothetical protein
MKSLLRKKAPIDNRQQPSPSPIQDTRQQTSTIETPLYARFATVKPGFPSQEKVRPVVSGPLPLGRPNRSNLDGEENRRRHETTLLQHRPIDARQGTPPITQSAPGSLPRDGQSPTNKRHQDARVNPAQASRQPFKAQTFCKSCTSFAAVGAETARRASITCQHCARPGLPSLAFALALS